MLRNRAVGVLVFVGLLAGGAVIASTADAQSSCDLALAEAAEVEAFHEFTTPDNEWQEAEKADALAFVADVRARCEVVTTTTTEASTTTTEATTTTAAPTTTTTAPTTTTTQPGGLPPGVTLRVVDGGAGYYGQFTNPLPDDPSFFPIGVWGSYAHEDAARDLDAAAGINTYVWLADESFLPDVQADGRFHVIQDGGMADPNYGSETAGWLLGDEVDMFQGAGACPGAIDAAKAALPDDGRFRYSNYGKGVTIWGVGGYAGHSTASAACFVNAQNVTSADLYWFSDPNESESEWPQVGDAWGYGWTVERLRQLDAMDGVRQPIWNFVETGHPMGGGGPSVTGPQIRAAVWHSIIAGARGIIYFQHSFGGPCVGDHHTIRSNCEGTRSTVVSVNAQIRSLAPVLNAPFVDGYVTASGGVRAMAKLGPDGAWYVFAASMGGAITESFVVAAGSTVTVVGESRTLAVTGGRFSDTFANGNSVHIYRVT